ncbi:MAG: hypothetical protein J6Q53_04990 [Oscillospiraceae bacterium]|nr:hypothetical protein [Oscillospiraceae bacterium]
MKDYEIFCAFISVMKHIGQIEELNLSKAGSITVEGTLPDGREVHLFVTVPLEGKV